MLSIELVKKEIKEDIVSTERDYDLKFWNLSDSELSIFLKVNYDEFFKNYSCELFHQQMKSYFELLSILAIENNKIVDRYFIVSSLYLIPYNTIKKFNNDVIFFDNSIIKEKFLESLELKTLTKIKKNNII